MGLYVSIKTTKKQLLSVDALTALFSLYGSITSLIPPEISLWPSFCLVFLCFSVILTLLLFILCDVLQSELTIYVSSTAFSLISQYISYGGLWFHVFTTNGRCIPLLTLCSSLPYVQGFHPERSCQCLRLLFLFLAFTTILYTRNMSMFRFIFCQRAFLFQLQACVVGTNL